MLEPLESHQECSGSTTNTSPASIACRASSEVIRISCSFSPGRMPISSCGTSGAIARARSTTCIDGILGTNTSPPSMFSSAYEHEVDRLGQRDPKARHALVGDRDAAVALELLLEHGHHRAAGADDVAVAHAREPRLTLRRVRVALHEDLLRAQLRRAVEVDGVDGLVGRQRDDSPDAGVDRGVDDVLRAEHVGAHGFEGVVLARRNLLHRGGVHDDVGRLRPLGSCGRGRGRRRSGSEPDGRRTGRASVTASARRASTRAPSRPASNRSRVPRTRCRTSRFRP